MSLPSTPAATGAPVQERHIAQCAATGHLTHLVNAVDTGLCPRCGAVKASPAPAATPEGQPSPAQAMATCEFCYAGPTTRCEPYCPGSLGWEDMEADPAYLAHEETLNAIFEGRATELTDCLMCLPVAQRFDGTRGPLRGVLGRRTVWGADPTEVCTLSCGHLIF